MPRAERTEFFGCFPCASSVLVVTMVRRLKRAPRAPVNVAASITEPRHKPLLLLIIFIRCHSSLGFACSPPKCLGRMCRLALCQWYLSLNAVSLPNSSAPYSIASSESSDDRFMRENPSSKTSWWKGEAFSEWQPKGGVENVKPERKHRSEGLQMWGSSGGDRIDIAIRDNESPSC
jgi:hypothetical protein